MQHGSEGLNEWKAGVVDTPGALTLTWQPEDIDALLLASNLLENPGLAMKMANLIGTPLEKGLSYLPADWQQQVEKITAKALYNALDITSLTLNDIPGTRASNTLHKMAVATTGGVGGFFGLAALAIELPLSVSIMLRSIADIARSEGERLDSMTAKQACIEVFAMGGPSKQDDSIDTGYFAVRAALAQSVAGSAQHLVEKGLTREAAPMLMQLISRIAERFSVQVSEKVAAQAIPAVGAAGGALINTLFIDHFQSMAQGHFVIRRLERQYGKAAVQAAYLNQLA